MLDPVPGDVDPATLKPGSARDPHLRPLRPLPEGPSRPRSEADPEGRRLTNYSPTSSWRANAIENGEIEYAELPVKSVVLHQMNQRPLDENN